MNLNEKYQALDTMDVETSLKLFPEQIKNAFIQAMSLDTISIDFDSVIVSGMGGSSNAGKIIQGLLEPGFQKPFFVYNDYELPNWVNGTTLVVLNSYSGNTEETLSAYAKARAKNCQIVAVTTGGKLAELVRNSDIQGVVLDPKVTNPTGFPKTGLGISLGGLIGLLNRIHVLNISSEELDHALSEVSSLRDTWDAKDIATWLHGSIPVLLSARPLLGALNAGRNAMCEISRNFTEFYDFPELNHVLIEATQKPESAKIKKYLFFESSYNSDRIKLRYKITKDIFKEQELDTNFYILKSSTILSQSLELAHYCAWLGFYISILDNTDPGPEPWILKLKEALSKTS